MKNSRLQPCSRAIFLIIALVMTASCVLDFALAQDYGNYTPPPPRKRRAYSTIDTYQYTHGTDPSYQSQRRAPSPKRVRKPRPKKEVAPATSDKVNTEGSTSTTSSTKPSTNTTASGKQETSDVTPKATSSASTTPVAKPQETSAPVAPSKPEASTTSVTTPPVSTDSGSTTSSTSGKWSDGAPKYSVSGAATSLTQTTKAGGFSFKTKLNLSAPDESSLNLPASKLSAIPAPQMPPPPTSIGGL